MPLAPNIADAELVSESLAGNREAFQQIVERYQSLICSLAYSATGNLNQSEDFAQETFITAWKQLPTLREPAKLRPWLCSIVRFRIGKNFRRQQHEPIHNAESLDEISTAVSSEPAPLEQTISHEEETILWRSLERIPEIYREPLVLFYREHQSIQSVASDLELSEDAVKQRLSRGRKLLQEQVLAFVEGTLERTNPGKAFTLGVIAALPLLATSAKAATVSATGAKGGTILKLLLMTKTTKTLIVAAVVLAVLTTTPVAIHYYWVNASKITSIHIRGEVCTYPADNFGAIAADQDFTPIDLWKEFGANGKWRVEKPGRVAVMDGQSTLLYIKAANLGYKLPKPSPSAFDTDWLQRMANFSGNLTNLIRNARRSRWNVERTNGMGESVVTILTKFNAPANDYGKNTFMDASDTRQVYHFNARTKRLKSVEIYLLNGTSDELVFRTDEITYNQATNGPMYHLDLPADISWIQDPQILPNNQKYASMTAPEAAAAFFEACSNQNWDEAAKFESPITPGIKEYLGGLQLISLGKPFTSKSYGGVFVPYEIKLHGEFCVRVSNGNPAKRWVLMGMYDDQLRLEEDLKWSGSPEILTNNDDYAKLSQVEAVKAYFDAQARLDWVEMRKFTSEYDVEETRDNVKELETQGMDARLQMPVFQSGQAFYSAKDSAWFVKCQIAQFKKWNLAIRNDNPAKRWQVDGGI